MTTLEREPRPRIKRLVVGRPKSSGEFEETLLPKRLALPIFASDALSSVAYATEAALVVLLAAAVTGRAALLPVSIAIAAPACDRDRLLSTDRPGLRVVRRRLRGRQGQSRHPPEPRRRRGAPHRLRAHRRGLRRRGSGRTRLGRAESRRPPGRSRAGVHRADHDREPPRRARVGARVRASDLRVHRLDARAGPRRRSTLRGR